VNKEIIPWNGYCYVHDRISAKEVSEAKQKYPDSLLLVHPECRPSVVNKADKVLSTGGMVSISKNSGHSTFLIGTEEGIIYRLKKENPKKKFYTAGIPKICINMKKIQIEDVYKSFPKTALPGNPLNPPSSREQLSRNSIYSIIL